MIVQEIISNHLAYFKKELADPRMNDRFLMSSPLPTLLLVVTYLILVKYILPAYMKNRPAFVLNNVLFYYNWFQVVLSAAIVYLSFGSGYGRRYSWFKCRDVDESTTDRDALMALFAVYLYFLSKFTEFFDTFFFVLRKKCNQVTFLHVFHHASMPVNAWLGAKIVPGGHSTMATGINASVHVVMYTYYLLSAMGPRWQKFLWWKKYLTTIQLVQFGFGLFQFSVILFSSSYDDCPKIYKTKYFMWYGLAYLTFLIYLFKRFYNNAYKEDSKTENENQTMNKKIK